jgi:uncharacterized membrane protein
MATITQLPAKQPQDSIKSEALPIKPSALRSLRSALRHIHPATWLLLSIALVFFNIFAYQVFLVPQERDYQPDWYGARWITAASAGGPVAYFRKTISLESIPSGAFLTLQGWQIYTVYVDGQLLDRTQFEFEGGATNLAHIYDITPFLKTGINAIAFCVMNEDEGAPAARAVLGLTFGEALQTFPTDRSWHATSDLQFVDQPCNMSGRPAWGNANFNDAPWQGASYVTGALPADGILHTNPAVFEQPLPASWITAGPGSDAFFYRSFNLPSLREAWLRVAATGKATIFLNGHRLAEEPPKIAIDQNNHTLPSSVALTAALYDISPYLRPGQNDLAVHVALVNARNQNNPAQMQPAALLLDLLATTSDGASVHISVDSSWQAATTAPSDWTSGNGVARWAPALLTAFANIRLVSPYKVLATHSQEVDLSSFLALVAITTLLLLLACLIGVGLQCLRQRSISTWAAALECVSLAFLPALALMALLFVLNLEPLMPHPFPFTALWLGILVGLVLFTFALTLITPRLPQFIEGRLARIVQRLRHVPLASLAVGLAVIVLTLVGFAMASYDLSYEPFWQDEVTSVYAAQGILQNGIPHMISGFIYPKGELFSYMLALVMALFGNNPDALRMLSVVEYTISLPLTYFIGRYFFGRRVGLLAMTLIVFSPMALRWGREARMYQQAELFSLLVLYLFYRALQPGARARYIYLSMLAVVLMYLSHEETFILLPAILLYFLATQRLSWVRNRHWWGAGLAAIAIIALQLLAVKVTHPPILGTDRTQRPLIAFSPENITFYAQLLFASRSLSHGTLAELGITSTLAVLAGLWAIFSHNQALRYLSLFLFLPLVCLSLIFSLTADRYIYPLLPVFAFLAAFVILRLADGAAWLARRRLRPLNRRALTFTFAALLICTTLAAQIPALANFGLSVSRTLGIPYHHRYPDYDQAGAYIRAHWQPGDILITVAPAIDGAFYGERPSYLLYQSKALYLFEQNDHIVDTPTGSTVLLNEQDFAEMLAQHHRIWLFSSVTYQCCGRTAKFPITQYFRLVYEGRNTLVYFRSG